MIDLVPFSQSCWRSYENKQQPKPKTPTICRMRRMLYEYKTKSRTYISVSNKRFTRSNNCKALTINNVTAR